VTTKPAILAGLLAALPLPSALAADLRLWIVEPDPRHVLADCPTRAAAAVTPPTASARLLAEDARLIWPDGHVTLAGENGRTEEVAALPEHCFALVGDGRIIATGAILSPHSARLLRFPVLLVKRREDGEPLELRLLPQFPAGAVAVPPGWRDALSGRR